MTTIWISAWLLKCYNEISLSVHGIYVRASRASVCASVCVYWLLSWSTHSSDPGYMLYQLYYLYLLYCCRCRCWCLFIYLFDCSLAGWHTVFLFIFNVLFFFEIMCLQSFCLFHCIQSEWVSSCVCLMYIRFVMWLHIGQYRIHIRHIHAHHRSVYELPINCMSLYKIIFSVLSLSLSLSIMNIFVCKHGKVASQPVSQQASQPSSERYTIWINETY